MAMDVNELRKGATFTMDNELYKVLDYQHHKPGRGKATIRTTLRNLRTGSTVQHNFISGSRVEDIRIDKNAMQYLYNDGDFYYFMDTESYEQITMPALMMSDAAPYLKDEQTIEIHFYEGEPIDVNVPITVELEVVETEMAVAGDTATGATKQVVLETGLKLAAPLFINVGDVIRVDTRKNSYITRV
jgi:elongation factor P